MSFLRENVLSLLICTVFFIAYSALSIVRHLHFGSFGFDLGIADQIVWEYSKFHAPITSIGDFPLTSELFTHVELIYILISPFYWLFNSVLTLLLLQTLTVCASGIPIFLLAKKHNLSPFISSALLISYLLFYGVQNAVWFDVHSNVFGTSFLAWFIYFLDSHRFRLSLFTFFLTIICKENFAYLTALISLSYLIYRKEKHQLLFISLSCIYLYGIFGVYFAHMVPLGYRFASKQGLVNGISPTFLFNTPEKREVVFVTFAWTGFLSFLQPMFLLPVIGNIILYFVLGRDVQGAQGLYMQYRIELAPLLFLATIYALKRVNRQYSVKIGTGILLLALIFQYALHLPLSYLTKSWFWRSSDSIKHINSILSSIPLNSSVVAQNNIVPHLSHRYYLFTLWPDKKKFGKNSPCQKASCNWFRWSANPKYLVVDTSKEWDTRHLLVNRTDFIDGIKNLEHAGIIKKYKQDDDAFIYQVMKNP